MLLLTKLFAVTGSDSDRNLSAEQALHIEIVQKGSSDASEGRVERTRKV
jgi:hypothetical protein